MKKGFELSINMVVIAAVAVLILIVGSLLFSTQSETSFSNAEANEIFFGKCELYRRQQCDWKVTYQNDFEEFYKACKQLNGPDVGKFSCLYKLCCATSEDVQCDGLCELCSANIIGASKEECCQRYLNTCSDSPARCGACGQ